jgi:hypothetical protein
MMLIFLFVLTFGFHLEQSTPLRICHHSCFIQTNTRNPFTSSFLLSLKARIGNTKDSMRPPHHFISQFQTDQTSLPLKIFSKYHDNIFTRPSFKLKASKGTEFVKSVKVEANQIQCWLENVYESVDYAAALKRAGIVDDWSDEQDDSGSDTEGEHYEQDIWSETDNSEVCEGKEGELTYGEMDLTFFVALINRLDPSEGSRFVDLGSGRGQLVLAAAKLRPWKLCTGIEIEPEVFEIGQGALDIAQQGDDPISPCKFVFGDIYNTTNPLFDADLVFAYATCFATSDGNVLSRLSKVLSENLKPECTVITVNKR